MHITESQELVIIYFNVIKLALPIKAKGCIRNPKSPTKLKCENIPGGSLLITREDETIPSPQFSLGELTRKKSGETCALV